MTGPVHIIGASGRSGLALSTSLLADGIPVVPVVRDPIKWATAGLSASPPRRADLCRPDAAGASLRSALADAAHIVSCAHARHTPVILAAAPASATLVLLGSTRKFTRWPDSHGDGVLTGEAALLAAGRPGVMLHPTMVYGARGEDNVQRLAAVLRWLPVTPLPGGGRALVQPIHQDDVTRCIRSALTLRWQSPRSLVIAGPTPIRYADFLRAVAKAAGQWRPYIVPFPALPLIAAAGLTRHIPVLPTVRPEEIRRLMEDKAFDISEMRETLRVEPLPLAEGLALTFRPHRP
jgi:nucleoside-diphosphate-sugar epimerase